MKVKKLIKYDIVTVLWLDHIGFQGATLPNDPDEMVDDATLTCGILYKETEKTLTVVSQIEPYEHHLETNYTIILKGAVVAMKRHGKLKLAELP